MFQTFRPQAQRDGKTGLACRGLGLIGFRVLGFGIKFRVEGLGLRVFVGGKPYRNVAPFFQRIWFRSEHVSRPPLYVAIPNELGYILNSLKGGYIGDYFGGY